jgi:cold shock CspA family protein
VLLEGITNVSGIRVKGTVRRYGHDDYGFVRTDAGDDIFVGASALRASGIHRALRPGERLEFQIAHTKKGEQAVAIRRLSSAEVLVVALVWPANPSALQQHGVMTGGAAERWRAVV